MLVLNGYIQVQESADIKELKKMKERRFGDVMGHLETSPSDATVGSALVVALVSEAPLDLLCDRRLELFSQRSSQPNFSKRAVMVDICCSFSTKILMNFFMTGGIRAMSSLRESTSISLHSAKKLSTFSAK